MSKKDLRSFAGLVNLRRQLRKLEFDISIDPQGLSKSAGLAWLSGARQRIGFHAPVGREVSTWLNNTLVPSRKSHVVDRYLELIAPLGQISAAAHFGLKPCAAATTAMLSTLSQPALQHGFAVLNPGAGWNSKLWPSERYALVADHLNSHHGLASLIVLAGESELDLARGIAARSSNALLAPKTSLRELAALLMNGKLFVGSDTGPLHLAVAVGAPCVGIYGPTRPEECGPYGAGHVTVQAYYQSGTCRQRRAADNAAMRQVSAQMVLEACDMALAQNGDVQSDRLTQRAA